MPSVYQIVTDRILDQLTKGVVPWQKPWTAGFTSPANLVSKKPYRGVNVFLLSAQGFSSPWWATFKQIQEMGGCVRKGERGTPIVFWKFLGQPETQEQPESAKRTRQVPLLRYYTVFNIEQADGVPAEKIPAAAPVQSLGDALAAAEQVLAEMPAAPSVHHVGGDRAFYDRSVDQITVPMREQFPITARYYSTLWHEMAHATGHESRLDRVFGKAFGDQDYAREELIAEMSAAFLAAEVGVTQTLEHSASYIATWLEALQNDSQLVVIAAGRAQKAVDFIRNRTAVPQPALQVFAQAA